MLFSHRKISRDLILSLLASVTTVLVVLTSLNYLVLTSHERRFFQEKANGYIEYLEKTLVQPIWNFDEVTVQHICTSIMKSDTVVGLRVTDALGQTLFEQYNKSQTALLARSGVVTREGRLLGGIEITLTARPYEEMIRYIFLASLLTFLAALAVMVGITHIILKKFLDKPLQSLHARIDRIASGDYGPDLQSYKQIEIEAIISKFNEMAMKIQVKESHLTDLNARLREEIQQREHSEEEMRQLRNYLSNIINSMPSMLIGVDPNGCVTQWNAAAEEATGVKEEKAQGQPLERLLPILNPQMDKLRQAMRTRKVESQTRVPRIVDGKTRYEDVTIYPLVSNGMEGAVIRVDEVTERVQIEEMMVQSEKMLSLGGLAAGMAHEINNPLGVILQSSQNILRRISPDLPANVRAAEECGISLSGIQEYLQRREILTFLQDIRQSGQRAAETVANMLNFSRKPDGGGTLADLGELLDRTVSLAANDYDLKKSYDFRQIEILREYQPEVPQVVCHESQIQQVFLNVLRNGAQAMRMAGRLDRTPQFVLRVLCDEDMVRVEIEDNGPGMDEAVRKRIFEPFFTTKPPGSGTGLGLSVSYFIVTEEHGGTMSVESNLGFGTRFVIRLPVAGKAS